MFTAIKKTAASATAIAIVAMVGVTTAPAFAGPNDGRNWRQGQQIDRDGGRNWQRNRDGRRGDYRRDHRRDNHHAQRRNNRDNTNAAIVGGIIGLGAAIVVGSALANQSHARPAYRPAAHPRPWSNDWYAYCGSKYRSFNPRTGYFLSYSGDYVFCR